MNRCVVFLMAVLLFACGSCRSGSTPASDIAEPISIEITGDVPEMYVGELIADYEVIPLETTQDNFIAQSDKLMVTDDYIVVVNHLRFDTISIFDKKGKSIAHIARKGRGPQEYLDLVDVSLTTDNRLIAALDAIGKKIVYYRFDGSFAGSQPLVYWFSGFEYLNEQYVAVVNYGQGEDDPGLSGSEYVDDLLFFTDPEFNIRSADIPNIYNENYHAKAPHLKKSGDEIFVNPSYSDTIYRVTPGKLQPAFHFDMKAINGRANFGADITDEKREDIQKSHPVFYGDFFKYADSCLFFSLSFPGEEPGRVELVHYVYDMRKEKLHKLLEYVQGATGEVMFNSAFLGSFVADGGRFVSEIPGYVIGMMPDEEKSRHPEFAGITDDSNPVLVFYTLKKSY